MKRAAIYIVLFSGFLFNVACVHQPRSAPARQPSSSVPSRADFIDLQPGWTVRVVVPMLRSGGYVVPSVKQSGAGNTIRLETGSDFLGYEKAFYRITSRREGGIRIRFSHAEVWQEGKTRIHHKPLLPLFADLAEARYIRLVFLIRVSQADHNMAIVAGTDWAALDELTRVVTQNAECRSVPLATCIWVPEGVAVTPEKN